MLKDDCHKRLRRAREAKLLAERERDDCLMQMDEYRAEILSGSVKLKSIRYRLRLARMALHAKRDTVRKRAFFLANHTIRLKRRNRELMARLDELTADNDRIQDTVDQFRMAQGLQKCPVCKQKRSFDSFPKEPRFTLGRNLSQCKSCDSKRVRELQTKRLHRQQHGEEE